MPYGSIRHIWGAGDFRPLAQAHLRMRSEINIEDRMLSGSYDAFIYYSSKAMCDKCENLSHHLCNAFLPALDDFLSADFEFKGLVSVS